MCNISLSFDDSRCDFYTNVFPLLKKHNLPATLNVITARVIQSEKNDPNRHYMTVEEVKECACSGLVEIASHSANHKNDINDVALSVSHIRNWLLSDRVFQGGYASPFSELTKNNLKEKGFEDLLINGKLKYIRSGTRTRREGLIFAVVQYVNQKLHSSLLYWRLNKKFIFTSINKIPFLSSVAVHSDTTNRMLNYFVNSMGDKQNVVFCFHGILRTNEAGYGSRFCWDYNKLDLFLHFLSSNKKIRVMTTAQLIEESRNN